jgi:hypothetical protein
VRRFGGTIFSRKCGVEWLARGARSILRPHLNFFKENYDVCGGSAKDSINHQHTYHGGGRVQDRTNDHNTFPSHSVGPTDSGNRNDDEHEHDSRPFFCNKYDSDGRTHDNMGSNHNGGASRLPSRVAIAASDSANLTRYFIFNFNFFVFLF